MFLNIFYQTKIVNGNLVTTFAFVFFYFMQTTPIRSLEKPLVTLTKQQREALEKRKLMWTKKRDNTKIVTVPTAVVTPTTTSNSWETVQFSQDTGGVVASKFLRLMGAKDVQPVAAVVGADVDPEAVEKRSQMFSTMERQFETALKTTHKKKGQGLGSGGPVATKKYF